MASSSRHAVKLFRAASARIAPTAPLRSYPTVSARLPKYTRPVAIQGGHRGISFQASRRSFSTSRPSQKGLSPETDNPQPKESESNATTASPADITPEKFHDISDEYLATLIEKLEQLQEDAEEVDCEYSAGVLTLTFPPNGTYVINKQPPNKQIWLSSPITGPKRYDYVILSEGQDAKEGTGKGDWIYLRDGSTLSGLLEKEIGIDMNPAVSH